jgi:hypothetical protein
MRRLRDDTSGRILAGLIVTMVMLVPLAVFGAPALARTGASASQYEYSSSAQYQYGKGKVTICHFTHSKKHPWRTIRVAWRGWLHGHSRHGDHLGACTGTEQLQLKQHGHKGHEGKDSQGQNENSQSNKSHGDKSHGDKSHGKHGNDD